MITCMFCFAMFCMDVLYVFCILYAYICMYLCICIFVCVYQGFIQVILISVWLHKKLNLHKILEHVGIEILSEILFFTRFLLSWAIYLSFRCKKAKIFQELYPLEPAPRLHSKSIAELTAPWDLFLYFTTFENSILHQKMGSSRAAWINPWYISLYFVCIRVICLSCRYLGCNLLAMLFG